MRRMLSVMALLAGTGFAVSASAQTVVLEEGFSDGTVAAAKFLPVPTGDWDVDFSFDYSGTTITATTGGSPVNGTTIPPAPNNEQGQPTTALKLAVNLSEGARETVNVFTQESFAGDYQVEVDAYYFHDNLSGSTEDPLFGINHSGDFPIKFWHPNSAYSEETDGYFFKAFGDVDVAGPDYFFLKGADGAVAQEDIDGLTWGDGEDAGLAGRDQAVTSEGSPTTLFADNFDGFPWGSDTPGGAMRWAWTTLRMDYMGGIVDLYANDAIIASYIDTDDPFTSGRVMLGLEDSFAGVNTGNFVLFTNLKVTSFTTDVQDWTLY